MSNKDKKKLPSAPRLPKDYTQNSKGIETGFSDDQKKELFNPFIDEEDGGAEGSPRYASGDGLDLNEYTDENPYLVNDEDLEEEARREREYALAQKKHMMPSVDTNKGKKKKKPAAPKVSAPTIKQPVVKDDSSDEGESIVDNSTDSTAPEEIDPALAFEEDVEEDSLESYEEDDTIDDNGTEYEVESDEESSGNSSSVKSLDEMSDEELFGDIDDLFGGDDDSGSGESLEDSGSDPFGDDDPFEQVDPSVDNEFEDKDVEEDFFGSDDDPFAEEDDEFSDNVANEFEEEEDDEIQFGQSTFDGFDVNSILADAIDEDASDIHISPNKGVFFTQLGDIVRKTEYPIPDGRITKAVQEYMTTNMADQDFIREKELDTAYVIKEDPFKRDRGEEQRHIGRRLRVSVGREFDDPFIVFRVIKDQIPTPDDLGIPDELIKWFEAPAGLILVNGSTGSGKTTSLAAILRQLQLTRPEKIITIEKPIEFVYPNDGKALITQREVGRDTLTFKKALTSAMRQAPDTILIGEVRDNEEIDALLFAADTGHLAISTMHTNSVAITLNRVKSMFDGDEQQHVLNQLADALQGIVNQVLVKTADGKGRFAVREMLSMNNEVRELISAGDVEGLREYQRRNKSTMEYQLAEAVHQGRCTLEAGRLKAENALDFDEALESLLKESEGSVIREEDIE